MKVSMDFRQIITHLLLRSGLLLLGGSLLLRCGLLLGGLLSVDVKDDNAVSITMTQTTRTQKQHVTS